MDGEKVAASPKGTKTIDLTGQRFGRLEVIGYFPHDRRNRQARWLVRCDCGTEKDVNGALLRSGSTRSCGCLRNEIHDRAAKRRDVIAAALKKARLDD